MKPLLIFAFICFMGCKTDIEQASTSALPIQEAQIDYAQEELEKLEALISEAESYFSVYQDFRQKDVKRNINDLQRKFTQISEKFSSQTPSASQIDIFNQYSMRFEAVNQIINDYAKHTIHEIVQNALTKVVDKEWGGGDNISTEFYEFYDNMNKVKINCAVEFYGQITNTQYIAKGELEYNVDDYSFKFEVTYKNEALSNYESLVNIGTVGAMSYSLYNELNSN